MADGRPRRYPGSAFSARRNLLGNDGVVGKPALGQVDGTARRGLGQVGRVLAAGLLQRQPRSGAIEIRLGTIETVSSCALADPRHHCAGKYCHLGCGHSARD